MDTNSVPNTNRWSKLSLRVRTTQTTFSGNNGAGRLASQQWNENRDDDEENDEKGDDRRRQSDDASRGFEGKTERHKTGLFQHLLPGATNHKPETESFSDRQPLHPPTLLKARTRDTKFSFNLQAPQRGPKETPSLPRLKTKRVRGSEAGS